MAKFAYINNQAFEIIEGETILSFVKRIYGEEEIPTLCHVDNLKPYGSCRICSVDVALKQDGACKAMASCHTPIAENFYIYPHSERIVKLRKNIMELVLSDFPKSSLEPKENRVMNEFQKLAKKINVSEIRYSEGKNHFNVNRDLSHPYIKSDLSECIYCYRCVRACDEIQGEQVLSVKGRGFDSCIIKGFDLSFEQSPCVSCGACVQTCPTNALFDRYDSKIQKADETVRTICSYCGVGCNLDVRVRDGEVVGITAPLDAEVNHGHTCLKGRFAWEFYKHPDRLKYPLIKENGTFRRASWDEAYELMANKFTEIREKYGADALAGIATARGTNEENYLMQKFMRAVIGTNNIDGCARVCHAPTAFGMQKTYGTGAATNSLADLKYADCIMLFGANPVDGHPVNGSKIRQEVMKGKKLIIVDPRKIDLCQYADYHLALKPGTNILLLSMFAYYIIKEDLIDKDFVNSRTEGFEEFKNSVMNIDLDKCESETGVDRELVRKAAILYASSKNSMSFHGLGITEHFQGARAIMLLSSIAMMTGNIGRPGVGINPLRGQNNVQGLADMGVQPHQGAGYFDVSKPENQEYYGKLYGVSHPKNAGWKIPEMLTASIMGNLKALWLIGEDLMQSDPDTTNVRNALESLEFLVVQELFMTETAMKADVVLPAACFLEKEGTFTNSERRIQRVNKAIDPPGEAKSDGQIIVEMMNKMGYKQPDYSAETLLREISEVIPFFKGVTWENLGINGKQWPVNENGEDTKILHKETFKKGLGTFIFTEYQATPEYNNLKDYPFILTTGRVLEHYNSGSMTRRTPNSDIVSDDYLTINTIDAERKGIKTGDKVSISSPRGSAILSAIVSDEVNEGVLYTTFHFPNIAINHITSCIGDLDTMTPEFKVVAVDFEKYAE